jgi:transcriptional regulator with XRE-family HTH domain
MSGAVSPVVRGRRLAAVLHRLRAESGRTVEEVAVHLECSAAKISRIENGLVGVRIQDARELLDLYGVDGARREEILDLVRQARGRGWWFPYGDVVTDGFERVLGYEDEAVSIWRLEARLVPGVLQTEDYAAALLNSRRDEPVDVVERRLELRMLRQRILTRPDPAELRLVLDEAVLLRRVGTAAVMDGQLRRLIAATEAANIALRILPLDGETHPAIGFSFTVYGFSDPADPKVVFEEAFDRDVLHDRVEQTARYIAGFEEAWGRAWSEADSLAHLARLLARRP